MLKLVLALAPLGLLIGVLFVVVKVLERRKTGDRSLRAERLPYRRRDALLSAAERNFHSALALALPQAGLGEASVMCKVRLADVLWIEKGLTASQRATARNRIERKHVDFVVCTGPERRPVLAIELDDASHDHPEAAGRDGFKDQAFEAAGLPLVRVRAQRAYSVEELATRLRGV